MKSESPRNIPRKIAVRGPDEGLVNDMETAIEVGVTDAKYVSVEMVSINGRVNSKYVYPRFGMYGTCTNCPPCDEYRTGEKSGRKISLRFVYLADSVHEAYRKYRMRPQGGPLVAEDAYNCFQGRSCGLI